VTIFVVGIALAALALMIGIEIAVIRSRKKPQKTHVHRHARRQPLLEDRIRESLEEPNAQYGQIFTSYMIWKHGQQTRMELFAGDPWLQLNEFTRAIVVRHIWRALEKLSKGCVVVVDQPPQEWSEHVDKSFDDRGIDPWGSAMPRPPADAGPNSPQFIRDR
jgi:hypothetical protein